MIWKRKKRKGGGVYFYLLENDTIVGTRILIEKQKEKKFEIQFRNRLNTKNLFFFYSLLFFYLFLLLVYTIASQDENKLILESLRCWLTKKYATVQLSARMFDFLCV